jgi:hypothetical protein
VTAADGQGRGVVEAGRRAELRVPLTEAGDPARIVSLVALTYRAADPPS